MSEISVFNGRAYMLNNMLKLGLCNYTRDIFQVI